MNSECKFLICLLLTLSKCKNPIDLYHLATPPLTKKVQFFCILWITPQGLDDMAWLLYSKKTLTISINNRRKKIKKRLSLSPQRIETSNWITVVITSDVSLSDAIGTHKEVGKTKENKKRNQFRGRKRHMAEIIDTFFFLFFFFLKRSIQTWKRW